MLIYHRLNGSKHFLWVLRSLPQLVALLQFVWFEPRPVDSPPSSILGQVSGDSLSGVSKNKNKYLPEYPPQPGVRMGHHCFRTFLIPLVPCAWGREANQKVECAEISPAERLSPASLLPSCTTSVSCQAPISSSFSPVFTPGCLPLWSQSTLSCLSLFGI